ncbi:YihY/virulence factor BrkB family protein [Thermoleophilia bacterium SCSIO 60948]|nr:YihY/virulence factor BrkB family protein [Thermoleophilia bacterium SCSIO 60948]
MSVAEGAPPGRRSFLRRRATWISAFWRRAYEENITGLAAMVAYNLALALFPFALLLLFIFGQVLSNPDVERAILNDLQGIFPAVEQDELARTLTRIQANSATIGVLAAAGAIWIGTSFWGAMDTAFCRIYHVECRSWLAQKRFALVMLVIVVAFLAASVVIPILEGLLLRGSSDLPLGLDSISWLDNVLFLLATLAITFVICSLIFYLVPKGHVPWKAVWPGALFVTLVMGLANAIFPVYLSEVSAIDRVGGALGFILIALLWFYLISLALMAGGVINALRYELKDTGTVKIPGWEPS